jgi:predicted nucleotidyltransferase
MPPVAVEAKLASNLVDSISGFSEEDPTGRYPLTAPGGRGFERSGASHAPGSQEVVARKVRGRGATKRASTKGKGALDAAVRRLVKALHPERIYLFGSRARGDAHQDSDYDFLLVVPDEAAAQRRALEERAREALSGLAASKDVLVYTVGQFERNRPVVASVSATVEREGRLLYGPPPATMEVLKPMEAAERRAALARTWLARASEDLAMARLATRAERPLLASAVYHCQRAFEKALKGGFWPGETGRYKGRTS